MTVLQHEYQLPALGGRSGQEAGQSSPSSLECGLTSTINVLYRELEPFNITDGNSNYSNDLLLDFGNNFSFNALEQNRNTSSGESSSSLQNRILSDVSAGTFTANADHAQVLASSAVSSHLLTYSSSSGASSAVSSHLPTHSSSICASSSVQPSSHVSNVGASGSSMCVPSTSASSLPQSPVLLADTPTGVRHILLQGLQSLARIDELTKNSTTPASHYHPSGDQLSSPLQLKSERIDMNLSECKVETTEEFLAEDDGHNSPRGSGCHSSQLSLCSPLSGTSGVEYTTLGGGGGGQQTYPSIAGPASMVSPASSTTSPYRNDISQLSLQGGIIASGLHSPLIRDAGEGANVADDGAAALPHHASTYHTMSGAAVPTDLWNVSYTIQTNALEDQQNTSAQVVRQQVYQEQRQASAGQLQQQQQHHQLQSQQMLQQQMQQQMNTVEFAAPVQLGNGQHLTSTAPPHLVSLPTQHYSGQHQQHHQQHQQHPQASSMAPQQYRYSVPQPYGHLISPHNAPAPLSMGQQHIGITTSPVTTNPQQQGAATAGRGRKRKQAPTSRMPAQQPQSTRDMTSINGIGPSTSSERHETLSNGVGVAYYPGDTVRTYGELTVSPPRAYIDPNCDPGCSASGTTNSGGGGGGGGGGGNDITDLSVSQYISNSSDVGGIDGDYEPPRKAVKTSTKSTVAVAAGTAAKLPPKKRVRPSSYLCGFCKQPFATPALLRKHHVDCNAVDLTANGNEVVLMQCTVKSCMFDTYDKGAFELHMRHHMTQEGLTPTGRKRQSKDPLKRHRYDKEEIHCDECPYVCTVEAAFVNHCDLHDRGVRITLFASCHICGVDLEGKADLRPHIEANHYITNLADGENHVKCDLCDFNSIQIKKLVQHRRLHTNEKPHACPKCNYRSARRDNLRSHFRRVHGADNIFGDTYRPVAYLNRRRKLKLDTKLAVDHTSVCDQEQSTADCYSGEMLQGTAMVMLGESSGLSITGDTLAFGGEHHHDQYAMVDPTLGNIHVSPLDDNYDDMADLMQPQAMGNGYSVWGESESVDQGPC